MTEQMKILLKTDRKLEIEVILQLLKEMTTAEQHEMLGFMQGVIFARDMERKKIAGTGRTI